MQIRYRVCNVESTDALKRWAERSLYLALGRSLGDVLQVTLLLDRGVTARVGVEAIRCRLHAKLKSGGEPLRLGAKEAKARAAIERAIAQLARSVSRRGDLRRLGF